MDANGREDAEAQKVSGVKSDAPSRYKVEKYRQQDGFGVERGPVLYGVADQEDDSLLASELLERDAILICAALNKQAQMQRELNELREFLCWALDNVVASVRASDKFQRARKAAGVEDAP